MTEKEYKEKLNEILEWKRKHFLECYHSFCRWSFRRYFMPCNVLSETKSGNIKIEVFGRRWHLSDKKRVIYVEKERILDATRFF